mmetsp:Transcript_107945/g.302363  ORF Transcript_107945/g.302363 Transcript_107945/m.302363 type:complete len:249 (-) Transcript_107945:18-764(-)
MAVAERALRRIVTWRGPGARVPVPEEKVALLQHVDVEVAGACHLPVQHPVPGAQVVGRGDEEELLAPVLHVHVVLQGAAAQPHVQRHYPVHVLLLEAAQPRPTHHLRLFRAHGLLRPLPRRRGPLRRPPRGRHPSVLRRHAEERHLALLADDAAVRHRLGLHVREGAHLDAAGEDVVPVLVHVHPEPRAVRHDHHVVDDLHVVGVEAPSVNYRRHPRRVGPRRARAEDHGRQHRRCATRACGVPVPGL